MNFGTLGCAILWSPFYGAADAYVRIGRAAGADGTIAKDFPEGAREHRFVRAETHPNRDDAAAFAVRKAQQIIDEQGDRLFGPAP